MKKKQIVSEQLWSDIGDGLEGSIEMAIAFLNSLSAKYPNHTNLRLDIPWLGWQGVQEMNLWGERPETGKEIANRKAKTNRLREKKQKDEAGCKARELKELKRLKAKYEKV